MKILSLFDGISCGRAAFKIDRSALHLPVYRKKGTGNRGRRLFMEYVRALYESGARWFCTKITTRYISG